MIEDPELRSLLEREAKAIRAEHNALSEHNTETFRRKLKLENRYQEIERLLGSKAPSSSEISFLKRRLIVSWLLAGFAIVFAVLGLLLVYGKVDSMEALATRNRELLQMLAPKVQKNEAAIERHEKLLQPQTKSVPK